MTILDRLHRRAGDLLGQWRRPAQRALHRPGHGHLQPVRLDRPRLRGLDPGGRPAARRAGGHPASRQRARRPGVDAGRAGRAAVVPGGPAGRLRQPGRPAGRRRDRRPGRHPELGLVVDAPTTSSSRSSPVRSSAACSSPCRSRSRSPSPSRSPSWPPRRPRTRPRTPPRTEATPPSRPGAVGRPAARPPISAPWPGVLVLTGMGGVAALARDLAKEVPSAAIVRGDLLARAIIGTEVGDDREGGAGPGVAQPAGRAAQPGVRRAGPRRRAGRAGVQRRERDRGVARGAGRGRRRAGAAPGRGRDDLRARDPGRAPPPRPPPLASDARVSTTAAIVVQA